MRIDGRAFDELRPVKVFPGFQEFAKGSTLIEVGKTKVICTVSVEDRVPSFMRGSGRGWITAQYGMLPGSTQVRTQRESAQGRPSGRTYEIQRLIGRSLRTVTDAKLLGERTFMVDCDVIQADGGTRTASITGAYLALYQAFHRLGNELPGSPLKNAVAATSVGIQNGKEILDLCYDEDSQAEVDFNVIMTDDGQFIELQGTAESVPFSRSTLNTLLALADKGIGQLLDIQRKAMSDIVAE